VIGKEYVAESLLESLAPFDLAGQRILLPRAAVARDVIPAELVRRGARIDVVDAYRTTLPETASAQILDVFSGRHKPHAITFASSSAVRNFVNAAGGVSVLDGVQVFTIGPVTTETAKNLGLSVTAQALEYTGAGMLTAIVDHFAGG
jgi:uroporphyrinogen III methyltransferase/synthase